MRVVPVIEALTDWGRRYEVDHEYRFAGGRCVPKVNIGAIRGGQPFLSIVSAERCYLYLDVRLTPAQTAMDVQAELQEVLAGLDVPTELECTLYRRGYEAVDVGAAPGRHRDRSPGRVRHGARRGGAAALEHVA